MDTDKLLEFSDSIQYAFHDLTLLEQALTHSSAGKPHNERLEFLGDSALGIVVSKILFSDFPDATEGDLTWLRVQIVNNADSLSHIGETISIDQVLKVDKGFPMNNHRARTNLLANAVEALIGAIYVDGGLAAAEQFIETHFSQVLQSATLEVKRNSKSLLQEHLQKLALSIPRYETIKQEGESHKPRFVVNCSIDTFGLTVQGEGGSIKEAEQNAAARAYEQLSRLS